MSPRPPRRDPAAHAKPRAPRSRDASVPPPAVAHNLLRLGLFLVPVVIGLLTSRAQIAADGQLGFPMDDPYIHFQYARNLATGHGFSFNPGEPSPGATSPLWVVLLAAGRMAGLPLEGLSIGLGLLWSGVVAVLVLELGIALGLGLVPAAIAALSVGACGRWTWASLSGMEIAFATAISLALLCVIAGPLRGTRRMLALGALLGLGVTARPEFALLGPLVLGLEAWRMRAGPRSAGRATAFAPAARERLAQLLILVVTAAVIALPYVMFCVATSGRPLPNTFYAKSLLPMAGDPHLPELRAGYLPLLWQWAYHDNAVAGLLLVPGMAWWAWRRMRPATAIVLLWPAVFALDALVLYPRHFSLSRYTMPLMPCFALLAMSVVEPLVARLSAAARPTALGTVAVLVAAGAIASQREYQPVYRADVLSIIKLQVRMARYVASSLPPDARIATNDVGAITYYGGRYCIDTVGLVTSDVITHFLAWKKTRPRLFAEEALPSYFRRNRPDYCILFPAWYPNMTRAPWLVRMAAASHLNTTGGGDELVLYRVVGEPRGQDE